LVTDYNGHHGINKHGVAKDKYEKHLEKAIKVGIDMSMQDGFINKP